VSDTALGTKDEVLPETISDTALLVHSLTTTYTILSTICGVIPQVRESFQELQA
jgi:hypothetical protein